MVFGELYFKENSDIQKKDENIYKNIEENELPEFFKLKKDIQNETKDIFSLEKVLTIAKNEIGIHEETRISDKYFTDFLKEYQEFKGKKISSKSINTTFDHWAWCAAFTSWCLRKAGYSGEITVRAKQFLKKEGTGHVAFKEGNNMIGGNQDNQVSLIPIPFEKIIGYAVPKKEKIDIFGKPKSLEEIPDGAILTFDRGWNDKQFT